MERLEFASAQLLIGAAALSFRIFGVQKLERDLGFGGRCLSVAVH